MTTFKIKISNDFRLEIDNRKNEEDMLLFVGNLGKGIEIKSKYVTAAKIYP